MSLAIKNATDGDTKPAAITHRFLPGMKRGSVLLQKKWPGVKRRNLLKRRPTARANGAKRNGKSAAVGGRLKVVVFYDNVRRIAAGCVYESSSRDLPPSRERSIRSFIA